MAKTVFLAVLVVIATRSVSRAQGLRTFAGGSVMFSSQSSPKFGNVGPSYPPAGVGGTAIGAMGEIGTLITPTFSIAFEFGIPNRFESVGVINYFSSYRISNRHRDFIFSGLFRFSTNNSGKAHLAVVGGPSFVREDTLQRIAFRLAPGFPFVGDFGSYGPETHLTRWTPGIAYGVDVPVDVSRHVSIVPDVRMYWISRAALGGSASGRLGLSSFVIRPAVGVRAAF